MHAESQSLGFKEMTNESWRLRNARKVDREGISKWKLSSTEASPCQTWRSFFSMILRIRKKCQGCILLRNHKIPFKPTPPHVPEKSSPIAIWNFLTRRKSPSHYHAWLTAARPTSLVVVHVHLVTIAAVMIQSTCGIARHLFVIPSDFPYAVEKGLFNVDTRLGRGFYEFTPKLSCGGFTICDMSDCEIVEAWRWAQTCYCHLPLAFQITLVSNQYDGEIILILDA